MPAAMQRSMRVLAQGMRSRWALPLVLLAPVLMAPPGTSCTVCTLVDSGALDDGVKVTHVESIESSKRYEVALGWTSGAADIDVTGDVTNVACSSEGDGEFCTFDAVADGVAKFTMAGLEDGTDYELYFGAAQ